MSTIRQQKRTLGNFSCNLFRNFVAPLRDKLHATLPSVTPQYATLENFIREMVKTIVLRQDPSFCKKTGGLFMYPPSPALKDGVLFV